MFNRLAGSCRRAAALLLLFGLTAFQGCHSVPRHPGVVTVPQPAVTEQDQAKWLVYYRDLFEANKGVVLAPSETAIAAQRQAYQQVSAEWTTRTDRPTLRQGTRNVAMFGAMAVAAGVVLVLFFWWLASGA
jgi:hypothetical protein